MKRFLLSAILGLLMVSPAWAVNDLTVDPIFLDTTGATSSITDSLTITAIVVNPTAATWVVELNDASAGDVVFKTQDNLQAPFGVTFPGKGLFATGLWATTLTDCEVLVYLQ